ncbi:isoflavone reductase family protein-like protein CipA [Lophiotrema nucula]|uniref:Isoflavone reductase family protein-like protein CipA n=1 Tax=Lophiotrema nucula TaxID=690887 RepID=A0A6A5ZC96_9PLEO|nr:isoflavone reductase family protein-like protein CipA [Lophiotrema nucula]
MTNNRTIPQPRTTGILYIGALIPLILVVTSYFGIFNTNHNNMSEIKNVILIGAGGNLGPSILDAFLEDGSFNVSVLTRESSSSTFPSSVKVHKADYNSIDSLKAAFQGQDAVLSFVGGTAIGDQEKLIDAAIAAGVKRFLPSEYGSNTPNPKVVEIVPIFKGKLGAVDYLKKKESEISWTSVITGPFFDWGLKVGFLGFDFKNKKASLVDDGKGTFSATNLNQIGKSLIKILQKPEETKNTYVYVSSFETTQRDILAAVEKITGDKYTTENASSKDLEKDGKEKLAKGDFSSIPILIKSAAFGEQNLGDSTPEGLWNEKLGLQKESFEDSIKAAISGKLLGEK